MLWMRNYFFLVVFLCYFFNGYTQIKSDSIDLNYLEDQLYFSLNYDILNNKPEGISQNGFSGGLAFGFIKDVPLNSQRNFGLGVGLGYSYNAYIQNLKIIHQDKITVLDIASEYEVNNFKMHSIEVPFEIRWRTSTPEKYKFWRVYSGIKVAYLIYSKSKYIDSFESIITKNNTDFSKIQYGITLATGYGTWNIYFYYGLKPLFNRVSLDNKRVNMRDMSIGVRFYIM